MNYRVQAVLLTLIPAGGICSSGLTQEPGFPEVEVEEIVAERVEPERVGVFGSLMWIAERQQEDGAWPEQVVNDDSKRVLLSKNHATALGLLAMLGAGQTHKEGRWKKEMAKALEYLVKQVRDEKEFADLRGGGDLQDHGVAAVALCEAYTMTLDRELLAPAQLAVRYTERCQNESGGWGRHPGKPDDIHQMGWHVMTLRSAWLGQLMTRENTVQRLDAFLDSQQVDDGRWYQRVMDGRDGKATAIGLLGRGETGWNPEKDQRWHAGAKWLCEQGLAEHDVEYNFWATQVVHHAPLETWEKWNEVMRDQLLQSQWKSGGHVGSWFDPKDRQADRGRFYQTALHTMMLEFYYRHMTAYRHTWKAQVAEREEAAEREATAKEVDSIVPSPPGPQKGDPEGDAEERFGENPFGCSTSF